ncbi:MAG: hypothetical protein ABJE10_19165 [bacterium]
MIRFDRRAGRLLLRTLYCITILAAAWVVANVTGAAATTFIYQGF